MFRNWPELFTKLSNITPATLTDKEKKELWRKNASTALNIDGEAYVVGRYVGQTSSGLSTALLYQAMWFLNQLREFQSRLKNNNELLDQLSRKLEHLGVDVSQGNRVGISGTRGLEPIGGGDGRIETGGLRE